MVDGDEDRVIRLAAAIARLKAGDLSARTDLIEDTYAQFRVFVRRKIFGDWRLRAHVDPSDLLHDALLGLYEEMESRQPGSEREFLGWMCRAIAHASIDLIRHFHGRGPGAARRPHFEAKPSLSGIAADDTDPADRAARAEEQVRIHERIVELPERYREVIELHYYGGLTHGQIALVLKVSAKTVQRELGFATAALGRGLRDGR